MKSSSGLRRSAALVLVTALTSAIASHAGVRAQVQNDGVPSSPLRLAATPHPPLPSRPSQYWLVPDTSVGRSATRPTDAAKLKFARGASLIANGDYAAGLAQIDTAALASTPLAPYAWYYSGVALAALSRAAEADAAFAAAEARRPDGYLREVLPLRIADLAGTRQDAKRALDTLKDLRDARLSAPEEVYLQLARAAERAGDRDEALKAYRRIYFDYPLSQQAIDAQAGLERLETIDQVPGDRFKQSLARAEKLFAAKRWAQARAAFEPLARVAQGDDEELTRLRLAECDYYLDRYRSARDGLRPYIEKSHREAEARFFYLTATRALGDFDTYVALARSLLTDVPEGPWAEETLNNLATHYILVDNDAEADRVFRELYGRMPGSRHAERAAWKIGWRAYRNRNFAEAASVFDGAAAAYPRADYRPSWLYWAARSHDQLGNRPFAVERYRLTVVDYQNSYYGRLAEQRLGAMGEPGTAAIVTVASATTVIDPVPTDGLIRELVGVQLYDDALREVQYAQRVWGDTPQLQATVAFIRHNQGLSLKATERFNALRGAINTMRRAYPQFMAAGGEDMPPDVLRIIFPLDFWPLITKYSQANGLDPYLVAALMAQESTFTPEIRSAANAYGLMQLVPAAGRQYARKLGIRYSQSLLTQAEPNVRMGTAYFKSLSDTFGGVHFALASYNAGPNRVAEWRREKPTLPADEFIDDIPYPETQTYVKRILGTAEDYRRLYGGGLLDPNAPLTASAFASTAPRASITPASSKRTSGVSSQKRTPAKRATKPPRKVGKSIGKPITPRSRSRR